MDHVGIVLGLELSRQNQKRLQQNRSLPATPGSPRSGNGLLAGIIRCGHCEYRLSVTHKRRNRCQYQCTSHLKKGVPPTCASVSAKEVDELVAQRVLQALEPAALELSLKAADDVDHERRRHHDIWQRKLDQVRYESERIERQYQSVEPEHRSVARTLESRWNEALQKEQTLREEYDRFLKQSLTELSQDERKTIQALSQSIPKLWHASGTTNIDRKDIVRCLVDRVVVTAQRDSEYVDVTIHWKEHFTSHHDISRTVATYEQMRDYDQLVERLRTFYAQGLTGEQMAAKLNDEGFTPPRRRNAYSKTMVTALLRKLNLVREVKRTDVLQENEWWVRGLADKLGVGTQKVYYWIKQEWIHSRRSPVKKVWIVWADDDEVERLEQLKTHISSWTAARSPELATPKKRG